MGIYMSEAVRGQPEVATEAELFLQQGAAFHIKDMAPQEELSQEAFSQFLGAVGVRQEVTPPEEQGEHVKTTLATAIEVAAYGTGEAAEEAEAVVDINVGTAVVEGYFKKQHRTEVTAELNERGEVVQFGKTKQQINFNSMVFRRNRDERLQAYTRAEALNACREEELIRAGVLNEYMLVVPSLVPDGIEEELLDYRGDGYFTSSMSFCLQGTTMRDGKVVTESVFDEGTAAPDTASFEERTDQRFDIQAMARVYKRCGIPAPSSPLEFLQNPLLIHKSRLPNGMVDFLRQVHEAADEVRGLPPQPRSEQQYIDLIAKSKAREDSLADARQEVKRRLLERAGSFDGPMDAIRTLWDLVKEVGVQTSITNRHIDPIVFGQQAAPHIYQARHYADIQDFEAMTRMLDKAYEVAVVSGCGGGSPSKEEGSGGAGADGEGESRRATVEDQYGSLEFKCQKGHTNFRPLNQLIPRCKVCGISVRC